MDIRRTIKVYVTEGKKRGFFGKKAQIISYVGSGYGIVKRELKTESIFSKIEELKTYEKVYVIGNMRADRIGEYIGRYIMLAKLQEKLGFQKK